jgi:AraC-like DNA-binding protein
MVDLSLKRSRSQIEEHPVNKYPISLIWQLLLIGTFSTFGRLECVASCYDPVICGYRHESLIGVIASEELDHTLRAVHRLVWDEWMNATFEQQHADLILYLRHPSIRLIDSLTSWCNTKVFINWLPQHVDPIQRSRFLSNLDILIDILKSEYGVNTHSPFGRKWPSTDTTLINKAVHIVKERYNCGDLTLAAIAKELHVSSRHLGRLFRQHLSMRFRQYLRDVRMDEAYRLLTGADDIKRIAVMVGYGSRRHFDADFRARTGSTPFQFRRKNLHPEIRT